jgi:hypothetical protein
MDSHVRIHIHVFTQARQRVSNQVSARKGVGGHKEMPQMPGMNLRLPIPNPLMLEASRHSQGQRQADRPEGFQTGGTEEDCSEMTLKAGSCQTLSGRTNEQHQPLAGIPSQLEPSTRNDHPDKHFLPCQLTGLASPGSCQAPAAGEKSPIIPAFVERQSGGSNSREACEVTAELLPRMWADQSAVCPVLLPALLHAQFSVGHSTREHVQGC